MEEPAPKRIKHYFVNGQVAEAREVAGADPANGQLPTDSGGAASFAAALAAGRTATAVTPRKNAADVTAALQVAGDACVRLFVAGAVTHVGKTTVCLSILAALRKAGLKPSELAYIKPATQCEAPDLLAKWCAAEGIEHVSGEHAPLVFYQGFTRSFLAGEQGTSAQWLERIGSHIDKLAAGRRVLIVDGVGFPSVGSIVGVDNADVAKAARSPVLIVCKSGVGAAVDSFSLNSSYFLAKGVPVVGAVFNMGDLEGFNSWDKCADNISRWFERRTSSATAGRERYYGVVPLAPALDGLRERIKECSQEQLLEFAGLNASHFADHVDLPGILSDAAADPWCRHAAPKTSALPPTKAVEASAPAFMQALAGGDSATKAFKPASRDAVKACAEKQGAKGGG